MLSPWARTLPPSRRPSLRGRHLGGSPGPLQVTARPSGWLSKPTATLSATSPPVARACGLGARVTPPCHSMGVSGRRKPRHGSWRSTSKAGLPGPGQVDRCPSTRRWPPPCGGRRRRTSDDGDTTAAVRLRALQPEALTRLSSTVVMVDRASSGLIVSRAAAWPSASAAPRNAMAASSLRSAARSALRRACRQMST